MLSRAIAAAAKTHRRADGTKATYVRGESEIPGLAVAMGVRTYEMVSADNSLLSSQSQDVLIVATDLVLAGELIEPREGDQIVISQPDGDHTYELMPVGDGRCWRWSDAYQVRYRVHTKETGVPDAG